MIRRQLLFIAGVLLLAVSTRAQGNLLTRINNLRAEQGLHAYTTHGALTAAAQQQAQWMATTSNVAHYRPDGSGPRDRALAAGYPSNWVSENIYMGTDATPDDAWRFWLNSQVHYAGLVSKYYQHIGIGSASANGVHAFVLVFGNPGGSLPGNSGNTGASSQGNASEADAPPPPPSFIVGQDEHGNIMHEIQPGDTLGDIALIYGYTWEDIPEMLALNELTEEDARILEVGSVFLVPPQSGTYTPTPEPSPTPAPPTATATPTHTPTPTVTPTLPPPATYIPPTTTPAGASAVSTGVTPTVVAARSTESAAVTSTASDPRAGPPGWLFGAIAIQVLVLFVAGFEFVRRARH